MNGVKIVDPGVHDYCPMMKNTQLFSVFNGQKLVKSFAVNHDDYMTATQCISANPEQFNFDWTHVRTATVQEARDWSQS